MSSLKKFDYRIKDNRKRNIFLCGIILVVVTIVGVKLYQSKAEFTSTTDEMNLVSGNVIIPGTHYLKNLAKTSKELMYDETVDNNLRYIGKDPNNYVEFNDELWRIIGVMNNIDDGTGKKESRIKLIRNKILEKFSWDCKQPGVGSSTSEYGSNDWSDSQLMMMLNPEDVVLENWQNQESKKSYTIDSEGYVLDSNNHKIYKKVGSYYNQTNGYKPAIVTTDNFTEEEIDFSENGLNNESKKLIGKTMWNLGSAHHNRNALENYNLEKNNFWNNTPHSWIGYIGLIYLSDYGFATSGGISIVPETNTQTEIDLQTCRETKLYDWQNSEFKGCLLTNWIYYLNEVSLWTLSLHNASDYHVEFFVNTGHTNAQPARSSKGILPVVYLKSSVKIVDGSGTEKEPFQLSL